MSTPTNDTYRWTRILMPACILWKFPQASKAVAHADKNVRTYTNKRKWSGLNAPSNWKLCYLVWTYESVGKSLCTDGAQTVPRRSPDGPQTVPSGKTHGPRPFQDSQREVPKPLSYNIEMVGDRVFFRWGPSGDRLGTVWGPSGHRCRLEFRNIYARNSPVRTKAITFTPLLTSFGCSKIPPSDHIDNLDAKHDGSHITRMTRMLKEQRHPTVSDHLDATVYRLLIHMYFLICFSSGWRNKLRKCWEAGNVLPVCSFETNNKHLSF